MHIFEGLKEFWLSIGDFLAQAYVGRCNYLQKNLESRLFGAFRKLASSREACRIVVYLVLGGAGLRPTVDRAITDFFQYISQDSL